MSKYMILHNAPEPSGEFMAHSSPEDMKRGMDDWMRWKDEAEKTVKFEFGMPLQAVARIYTDKVTDSDNPAGGYSMIEADSKQQVIDVLRNHPHLGRMGTSIDVLEIIPMPGI
ncbi:MAG: hypothetical protein NTV39_02705 [Candidatus Saccharibacteria bacterium]|nr:hypothetical protein [Candidatus Saccharibacteria bacterium]